MTVKENNCCALEKLTYTLVLDDNVVVSKCNSGCCKRQTKRIAWTTLKLLLLVSFFIFVVFPLYYKFSYRTQQRAVFLNFVQWPKDPDYSSPWKYDLPGTRNFYLTTDDGVRLGVWHVLPEALKNTPNTTEDEEYERLLNNSQDIVIYNHGNSNHRAAEHRIELYKLLRKHFHVIAYDYRSYGDSSSDDPTENGLVSDSMFIFRWVMNRTDSNIFVWGHSLGTSISTHSLALLNSQGIQPAGLILEAPFNNMREEISEHPFTAIFKNLPWFSYTVVEPMQANDFKFQTDVHINNVDCPIMIIHAEDDGVVPFKLGQKLYENALTNRRGDQGSITFHRFASKFHYGHKYICRAPELENLISDFVKKSLAKDGR